MGGFAYRCKVWKRFLIALSRILKHELTHSFLYQKTQGRCPTWLQEGVAQWMEGRRGGGTRRSCWQCSKAARENRFGLLKERG